MLACKQAFDLRKQAFVPQIMYACRPLLADPHENLNDFNVTITNSAGARSCAVAQMSASGSCCCCCLLLPVIACMLSKKQQVEAERRSSFALLHP
jgi:hypothetical protein